MNPASRTHPSAAPQARPKPSRTPRLNATYRLGRAALMAFAPLMAVFSTVCAPPAHAADALVVGRSLALSGPLKAYGEAKRDGGDALIAKVNAAGGIAGRKVQLITLDDVYSPATTVANLRALAAEHKPTAFLGLFGVPTVAAALPVLNELQIPAVGLTSGTDAVRAAGNRFAFPVRASYADEARQLVRHAKVLNVTKMTIIYTENPFGETVKNTLLATLAEYAMTAKLVKLDPAGKDAAAAAKAVATTETQAVFLTMLSNAALPMLGALKAADFNGALYTFSPVDTTVITQQLGAKAHGLAISQVVPIPSGSRVPVVAEYLAALKALGRGTPSFYGLEAFIEAKVLVEGLRRTAGRPSALGLAKALETLNDFDLGGFYVTYKPELHRGSSFAEIDVINSQGVVVR